MSISRFTTVVVYAAILAGTWVASIPVAESVFRLLGDKPSADMEGLFVPFANGNYKLRPFVHTEAFFAQGRVSVYTDGLGLRCDKAYRLAAKPGDAIDVLLIGDSQGFGNGVNFEETIAGSLAATEAQRGYRVSNASVGGHSLASQYELARWLVEEQGLKVKNFVVLLTPAMIYASDHLNHVTVGEDGRLYATTVDLGTQLRLWAKTHSVVYLRVRDAIRNSGIGVEPVKENSASVFEFYRVGEQSKATLDRLLAFVQKFQKFAAQNGAAIHLVYVPLTVEADFGLVRQAAAKGGIKLDPDIPLHICSSVAERLHIPLYNLKPVLERLQAEGCRLNVIADFHYSPDLSQACGSNLAAELKISLNESQPNTNNTRE